MPKELKIVFGILTVVVIAVIVILASQNTPAATSEKLIGSAIHMTSKKDAKVTIVVFGDYECPACGVAHPVTKQVVKDYANNPEVNFVFRNFPLPQHTHALISAQAAEAAGAQGKFWEMHDMLYEHQSDWVTSTDSLAIFETYATQLGLDVQKFKQDVSTNAYQSVINKDMADATALNVQWTPSIYINGVLEQKIPSLAEFKSKIDALLK